MTGMTTMALDAELAALAAELAATQTAAARRGLAERNVVELVLKLRDQGEIDLVFSLSGKEFVTPERLREEMRDQLDAQGGRARLDEMAAALDLDLAVVEAAAQDLVRDQDLGLEFLTPLEIIAPGFREALCREIDELLHNGAAQVTLGSLASEHAVPVDFARRTVTHGVSQALIRHAKLQGNTLRTDAYEAALTRKALGALLAVTRPTLVVRIAQAAEMDAGDLERLLSQPAGEAADQALHALGSVQNGEFIPSSFAAKQRQAVDNYFSQNNCLPRDVARSLHLGPAGAFAFVRQSFPDACELADSIVSATTQQALEASIHEVVSSRTWVDVAALEILPHQLSETDVAELLAKSGATAARANVLGSHLVVSRSLLNAVQAHLETAARDAQALAAQRTASDAVGATVRDLVTQNFDQLADAPPEVLASVCAEVEPYYREAVRRARAEADNSVILHGAAALLQRQSQLEASFAELYADLQMYTKAASRVAPLGASPSFLQGLCALVIARSVKPMMGLMTEHQCIQHGEPLEGSDVTRVRSSVGQASTGNILFNPAWTSLEICRAAVVDKLPENASARKALTAGLEACMTDDATENLDEAVRLVEDAGRECCFVVRAIDKKSERARMQSRRAWLLDQIAKTTSEDFLGACVAVLVLQQCKQVALPVPRYPMEALDTNVLGGLIEPACECLAQTPDRRDDLRALAAGHAVDDALLERIRAFAALKNPSKGK